MHCLPYIFLCFMMFSVYDLTSDDGLCPASVLRRSIIQGTAKAEVVVWHDGRWRAKKRQPH